MAWTYDPTKFNDTTVSSDYPPATLGQLMQVRFLIRDTSTSRQLLQDDEIYWLITIEANIFMAACVACESLVAIAGNVRAKTISEFKIVYDTAFYTRLAGYLRGRGSTHQIPYVGGISISDKEVQQANADWVAPAIARGLDNNPTAPSPVTPPSNPLTTI